MANTAGRPKRVSNRKAKKADRVRLPVPIDELPEYRNAVEWALSVRAEAERRIAREASEAPIGVMRRIDGLVGEIITERQRDLVALWSGVGARSKGGYHSEYYAIRELMLDFSLLPCIEDDVGEWWLYHADGRGKGHDECVNFHALIDGHYLAESETALLLKDALRAVLASLLPGIPTATALLGMLRARQLALPEEERRRVTLSEVVEILNAIEWRRDRIESADRSHIGRRHGVKDVHAALSEAGLEDFVVDCGPVRGAAQMREFIAEFGARVRACAASGCGNWFAVDEDKVPYDWYDRCPGCSTDGPKGVFIGGNSGKSKEQALIDGVRGWTERSIDVAIEVALAEGTTAGHARELLAGDAEKSVEEVKAELKACPLAAECKTVCGALQAKGLRSIPIAPSDGRYGSCRIYRFMSMADGVEGEMRETIAEEWIRQINDEARGVAGGRARTSASDAEECEEDAQVTVQTTMF